MRKVLVLICVTALLVSACCGAMAAGVTIRAFTPFADLDGSAQSYMDMITAWEAETGNVVEDYSGLMDEAWMEQMMQMARDGEADVLVLPMGTGLTDEELVTVWETYMAVPDLGVRQFAAMEEGGSVLLSPLRVSWEALYVNTDVLARYELATPETYEELLAVCSVLAGNGILPIANALCEWPEIVLDCAALAMAEPEQYGSEASLAGAQQMLTTLCAVGAFGSDPWNAGDYETMQAFLNGEAAMRMDSDILAQDVPQERLDDVVVIPLPQRTGESHSVMAGTPSLGVAISRACWADDARCEAAISFVRTLLSPKYYGEMAVGVGGQLGESIAQMMLGATDCAGILYDAMEGDFDAWAESVIASLMAQ